MLKFFNFEQVRMYLSLIQIPSLTGIHNNTAFSFSLLIDYSRMKEDGILEEKIKEKSLQLFERIEIGMDQITNYEFLSPNLSIIHLYTKIKEKQEFNKWLMKQKDWKKLLGEIEFFFFFVYIFTLFILNFFLKNKIFLLLVVTPIILYLVI